MRSVPPGRRARTVLAATTTAAAALATAALGAGPAAGAETSVDRYVALGDSFASAAGVPDQVDSACMRSDRNYPALVRASLTPAAHRDVSCGGATTVHMTTAQNASAPPQFDALSADTDVVTLTIGGNDIGFADIIVRCVSLGLFNPFGSPCKSSYTWTGTDQLAATVNATAPKIAAAIDGVRQRAPHATILVTGYPAILPDDGTNCPSVVSIAKGDAPWLRDTHKRLNAMIATQAAQRGAVYVDTYTKSIGHDACKPAGTRWMEPLFTNAAAPFHPNAAGERAMADAVLAALR
ncbi:MULTISPECIES: SGNH/GDSL hydrolase family protein [Streptomyces]|uniref:GDSL family lipase n=2 Tax=Streptomyces TaxID=1883 RepID=A0A100Y4C1_9ACTN|nr:MULTISPECIES: SGNH/GDSL hydrolase family protein [Streptomyces]KUH37465.1 GDSL family lipase [Streptomyces kanasensis]UUS33319.1 SGNH/GDSL hydrolase family protein [Streptomyces changanensis]